MAKGRYKLTPDGWQPDTEQAKSDGSIATQPETAVKVSTAAIEPTKKEPPKKQEEKQPTTAKELRRG